jgi:hypothetical protein
MNVAERAIQNLATADAAIRGGLRAENENAIVRYCMLTEERLVGPAAGDEGVFRHYYYSPSYITVADVHYRVVASVPDLSVAQYNDEGNVRFLRMYLVLNRANENIVWNTLQVAQVLVDLERNEEAAGEFAENRPVIHLREVNAFGLKETIAEGLHTLTNIALGDQKVW